MNQDHAFSIIVAVKRRFNPFSHALWQIF